MEEDLIILVALDPNPVDCDWELLEFGANVTKKSKLGCWGLRDEDSDTDSIADFLSRLIVMLP